MKKLSQLTYLVTFSVFLGTPLNLLNAQSLLLSDVFTSHPTGGFPGDPWVAGATTGGTMTIEQDSLDLFGLGTDNQYFRFNADVGTGSIRAEVLNYFPAGEGPAVFTWSLQFIETQEGHAGTSSRFVLRAYTEEGFGGQLPQIDFRNDLRNNGHLNPRGQVTRLDWVVNISSESVDYVVGGDNYSVASASSDVWIDGNLVIPAHGATDIIGNLTGLDLRTFSNNRIEVLVNEFGIFDGALVGAPIPEPSTYGLIAGILGVAALVARGRRRLQHR